MTGAIYNARARKTGSSSNHKPLGAGFLTTEPEASDRPPIGGGPKRGSV